MMLILKLFYSKVHKEQKIEREVKKMNYLENIIETIFESIKYIDEDGNEYFFYVISFQKSK